MRHVPLWLLGTRSVAAVRVLPLESPLLGTPLDNVQVLLEQRVALRGHTVWHTSHVARHVKKRVVQCVVKAFKNVWCHTSWNVQAMSIGNSTVRQYGSEPRLRKEE